VRHDSVRELADAMATLVADRGMRSDSRAEQADDRALQHRGVRGRIVAACLGVTGREAVGARAVAA
jgi:hypothetical protein